MNDLRTVSKRRFHSLEPTISEFEIARQCRPASNSERVVSGWAKTGVAIDQRGKIDLASTIDLRHYREHVANLRFLAMLDAELATARQFFGISPAAAGKAVFEAVELRNRSRSIPVRI